MLVKSLKIATVAVALLFNPIVASAQEKVEVHLLAIDSKKRPVLSGSSVKWTIFRADNGKEVLKTRRGSTFVKIEPGVRYRAVAKLGDDKRGSREFQVNSGSRNKVEVSLQ